MKNDIRELSNEEILNVAGGEPGDNICPEPRHWPFPHPWTVVQFINPVTLPVGQIGIH